MKCRHRRIVERELALLSTSSVPIQFWHYVLQISLYLLNRLPIRNLPCLCPFEVLTGTKPDYSYLKVIGFKSFPCIRAYHTTKLDPCSLKFVFLGYFLS